MPIHMGVVEWISTVGRGRGRAVFIKIGRDMWGSDMPSPSKLGSHSGCADPVGASLLATNDDAVLLTESAALALL